MSHMVGDSISAKGNRYTCIALIRDWASTEREGAVCGWLQCGRESRPVVDIAAAPKRR